MSKTSHHMTRPIVLQEKTVSKRPWVLIEWFYYPQGTEKINTKRLQKWIPNADYNIPKRLYHHMKTEEDFIKSRQELDAIDDRVKFDKVDELDAEIDENLKQENLKAEMSVSNEPIEIFDSDDDDLIQIEYINQPETSDDMDLLMENEKSFTSVAVQTDPILFQSSKMWQKEKEELVRTIAFLKEQYYRYTLKFK